MFLRMDPAVTAACVAPSPMISILTLLGFLSITGSPDLPQQLLGAFQSKLRVTKKILQRNYLEKHLKLGLGTSHSQFITKQMMRAYKTNYTEEDYECNFKSTNHQILELSLNDAERDLDIARKLSSRLSEDVFRMIKSTTRKKTFKKFFKYRIEWVARVIGNK